MTSNTYLCDRCGAATPDDQSNWLYDWRVCDACHENTAMVAITPEVHDALLTAADMVSDTIGLLNLRETPYAGEALGDVRDLLLAIAAGDLSALSR